MKHKNRVYLNQKSRIGKIPVLGVNSIKMQLGTLSKLHLLLIIKG